MLEVFEPKSAEEVQRGTSCGGSATCPVTSFTTSVERVRDQLNKRSGGSHDGRLIAVVTVRPGVEGRQYRVATRCDSEAMSNASALLQFAARESDKASGGLPSGRLNHLRGFFNVVLYGMVRWYMLFNERQLLVLVKLSEMIDKASASERISGDPSFVEAAEACVALVLGRMADANSTLAQWQVTGEKIGHTFGRQALPMVWDYSEVNPFCEATRNLASMFEWVIKVIEREGTLPNPGFADQASATRHPLPDDSVDSICTDPPYYAAVPYADLSDFFYSWIAPLLRRWQPRLFGSELTPKDEECVQLSHRAAMYRNKDKSFFESTMESCCGESRRVLRPSGIGVFVFASKETAAWEAMLSALVNSGWIVTASWPIDTEMGSRLRAMNSATLASSIHISGRPRESPGGSVRTDEVGDWREVLTELPHRIHEWMPRLAAEGVVGADAIFACLGPALEIFSRYSRVEKSDGSLVPLREYLEHVWAAVSKEALSMIFKDADASGLEPDARLTAMWLWTVRPDASGTNGNGSPEEEAGEVQDAEDEDPQDHPFAGGGYAIEFDAVRRSPRGWGPISTP